VTVPTPTAPKGLSQQEALYRRAALSQLHILKQQMTLGGLKEGTRSVNLGNGVVVTCRISYNKEDIFVYVPTVIADQPATSTESIATGIVIHPRIGSVHLIAHMENGEWKSVIHGVSGGWKDGKTLLDTNYIYPLVDGDNASYGITAIGDEPKGSFLRSNGNYGNLYWWNGDSNKPVLLSWKGTPTRHFRLDSTTYINGLVEQETTSPGEFEDVVYYTSFGQNIYQNGVVFAAAPKWNWPRNGQDRCFILGAMKDSSGTVWSVMQSDRYNAPKNIYIFSDGHRIETEDTADKGSYLAEHPSVTLLFEKSYPDKLGIYTMLWKLGGPVDGWAFVAEHNTGRQGLPWFGNASGTIFAGPYGSTLDTLGSLTQQDVSFGVYTEPEEVCSDSSFSAHYEGTAFSEFRVDNRITTTTSFEFYSSSTKSSTSVGVKVFSGDFDVLYDPEVYTPQPLTAIGGTDAIVVGQGVYIETVGGQGEITITYSGFTVENGIVTSAPCAMDGDSEAGGSITATDACGGTATWKARLPNGVWVTTGWTYFGCSGLSCCDQYGHFFSDSWVFCGNHYSMDTTCKFSYTSEGTYSSSESTSGTRKNYASWGCFYTEAGSTWPTTLEGYFFGDRGTAPAAPAGVTCSIGAGYTLLPNHQSSSKWVCP